MTEALNPTTARNWNLQKGDHSLVESFIRHHSTCQCPDPSWWDSTQRTQIKYAQTLAHRNGINGYCFNLVSSLYIMYVYIISTSCLYLYLYLQLTGVCISDSFPEKQDQQDVCMYIYPAYMCASTYPERLFDWCTLKNWLSWLWRLSESEISWEKPIVLRWRKKS